MNELTLYSTMTRHQAWALMVAILFITTATCEDSETIHIITSASSSCPGELTGEPCITLSEYLSGVYRHYYKIDPSEIVLEFGPGRHWIASYYRTIFASQVISFRMNSEYSAEIYCYHDSQYLITNVQNVHIRGINFLHCSLQIESVMNFILEESSFTVYSY